MDDILKPIVDTVNKFKKYDGKIIISNNEQIAGTMADKMDLPLSKRLAQTDEEAMTRARLEATKRAQVIENDGAEHDEAVEKMFVDDLIEKFLKALEG